MRHVNARLISNSGKTLWASSFCVPESGSISIGRLSIFDKICSSFAESEWAVVTVFEDFILLDSSDGRLFGMICAELTFRRDRKLIIELTRVSNAVELQPDSKMEIWTSKHLEVLPEATVYKNPSFRRVVENILMVGEIFDANGRVHEGVNLRTLSREISSRIADFGFGDQGPVHQLKCLVSLFWMLVSYVFAEGPLTRWLRMSGTQEILFNGHDECWIERGGQLYRHSSPFVSWDDLHAWLSRQSMLAGVDLISPRGCVDFSMACGARVHLAHAPVSRNFGYVSIRCHREGGFSLAELSSAQLVSPEQCAILESWITERKNILIAGATSSGKTTLLKALVESVSADERIIVLEDVAELKLTHDHVVYLQTFESLEPEIRRSIGLESLVREALRMRPDRLVVGECRGHEAFALVQALHTGHRGSMSTVHANSAKDALSRLETMMIRAEPSLDSRVVRTLVRGAFDAVIFVERIHGVGRRISGLHLMQELVEQ